MSLVNSVACLTLLKVQNVTSTNNYQNQYNSLIDSLT